MDSLPPGWHAVDEGGQRAAPSPGAPPSRKLTVALALGAVGAVAAAAVYLAVVTPRPEVVLDAASAGPVSSPAASPGAGTTLFVDVEGAVARPGLHELPAGSRVGDAIRSAGGFDARVDAIAATRQLNLAAPLEDGAKIEVPIRGAPTAERPRPAGRDAPGAAPSGAPTGTRVDLNSADQAALESLPGIGPVTAGKIIAARQQQPFRSVEELQARDVVGPSTFEKIRDLVTVGP